LSIQQDFYAKIVASNLTALMEIAAQKKVDKRTHDLELNVDTLFRTQKLRFTP
jgi:hypothetical protein